MRNSRRYANAVRAVIDKLESRTLFASISGNVFVDYNANGKDDGGEGGPGNGTQTIFIDNNGNGLVDSGEQKTSVDAFGDYSFSVPTTGTYRVTLLQDTGYIRTYPAVDYVNVNITSASEAVSGVAFGITGEALVYGTIYNDANGNGKQDNSEPTLSGASAYLDVNGNGKLDSAASTTSSASKLNLNTTNTNGIASDLTVSNAPGDVLDVNVTLNISTSNVNDPQVYLEDPQGVRVLLISPLDTIAQSGKSNFSNTVFDDQSSTPLSSGTAPYSGTYQTSGNADGNGLSQFNGVPANGRWRLIVQNTAVGTTMILNNWSLKITSGDPSQTTSTSGAYYIYANPGTYAVRAAETNFITTQPNASAGGKVTTTVNYGDSHEADFGLQEIGTRNRTVTFSSASNLSNGTTDSPFGLVSSDFNGDGKLDIAAADNGSNDVGIYTGKGNGQFNNPTFLTAGNAPRGLAMGDFNGDTKMDLVVANHDNNNVGVFLSNGNGTFKPMVTYPGISGAWAVAVGDFNGDGKLDIAVGGDGSNYVQILLGNGNGTFKTGNKVFVGAYPTALAVADMNGDKKLDLVVANENDNTVAVLLGNGSGGFASPTTTIVGSSPDGIAIADLNGDKKLDVVTANYGDDTINVLLGNGSGGFTSNSNIPAGSFPASATIADLNNDGKPDLIIGNRSDGGSTPSGSILVYLGNGDGTFNAPFTYTADQSPVAVVAGDFNGDGYADLAASNFNSDNVSVLLNTSKPSTTGPAKLSGTTIGTAGSYNNDGNTIAKATDGNLSTFFDSSTANGNWVGLDLGVTGGIVTQVEYASRSGLASRMNGGIFQASDSATFASGVVNLYTIPAGANPSSTSLTTSTFTNTTAYRYYRYLSPNGSYGDVAEVQFFGKAGGLTTALTKLSGTTIGTSGSYSNDGNTIAKATDGNLATFFDGATANGNWVGLDLGSAKSVSQISYAPRSGLASRMVGGIFQESTTANFSSGVTNIATITATPATGSLTTITLSSPITARYFRYLSPNGSYGDISEFQLFG